MTDASPDYGSDAQREYRDSVEEYHQIKRNDANGTPCQGCAKLFDELAALRQMVVTIGEQNNWIVETLLQFQQGFQGIQSQMASMGPMAMVKAMVGGKKNGRPEA